MTIKDFLARKSVFLDLRAAEKTTLLRELSQRAADLVHVSAEAINAELSRREELGSTGIGGGVAIPHARFSGIDAPFALAARLKPPVNFDSIDDFPVDLVFVLLLPATSHADHLNALAAISRRLRDRLVLEQLRSSKDADGFYRALVGA